MAENKSKPTAKEKTGEAKAREGGSWLKLPKMWADTGAEAADETGDAQTRGDAAYAAEVSEETPGDETTVDENEVAEVAGIEEALADAGQLSDDDGSVVGNEVVTPERDSLKYYEALGNEADMSERQAVADNLAEIKAEMERMSHIIGELNERETGMEQVFNTLHGELMGYKKDFIYEHLKPVVRPLLFLYDSLEQFDHEIEEYERPSTDERRQEGLSPRLVRENIGYFREQLVEALRICEVTLMDVSSDEFDPKQHKAIDVAAVDEEQDGKIVRVVRTGWCLNNQVLRPVEVVMGKANLSKNETDKK